MDNKKVRNEAPLTKHLFYKASGLKLPLNGAFELSPVCNFSCRMCYVRKTAREVAAHDRPAMTLDCWLDLARQARDSGMLYLLLTGGEPFLWPDFWPLYEQLHRMGFVISINTNGSLIDDDAVARLKAMPPMRLNITLYGASDETYYDLCGVHGAFDRVDRAITRLREAGLLVKLNCSLTPQNAGDLEQIVQYAKDRNMVLSVATYMFPPIRREAGMIGQNQRFTPEEAAWYRMRTCLLQNGEAEYKKLLGSILCGAIPSPGLDEACVDPVDGKIRCRAGKASFWITWDGFMTPCSIMPEPKIDLNGKSFSQAWQELTEVCGSLSLSGVCDKCSNVDICHACAATAIAETGSAQGISKYLCQMVEAMKALAHQELSQ